MTPMELRTPSMVLPLQSKATLPNKESEHPLRPKEIDCPLQGRGQNADFSTLQISRVVLNGLMVAIDVAPQPHMRHHNEAFFRSICENTLKKSG